MSPINVRQRQYGFALQGSENALLITENIFVCSAWFGYCRDAGAAFLCHFDSPASVRLLPEIIREFQELTSTSEKFESYLLNGSVLAYWLRTKWTRQRIMEEVGKLDCFSEAPIDLGFVDRGLRSSVVVNPSTFSWERKAYTWQPMSSKVCARTRLMTKAEGSA